MSNPVIRLQSVEKRYATGLLAVDGVSLDVAGGEFVTLLGPSGCGKSTLLRMMAGLETPTAGQVASPAWRSALNSETAFVFQDASLMPWADVFTNVWLPLRLRGVSKRQARDAVVGALRAVGLDGFAEAVPSELSGGMRMRASIARALVAQPRVLLMDEPFAALDEITRQRLNIDLLQNWQAGGFAVVFVTHSVFEAVFLSQRVMVMSSRPGRIVYEARIDEPYPRSHGFRTSMQYAQWSRDLSEALAFASEPAPVSSIAA